MGPAFLARTGGQIKVQIISDQDALADLREAGDLKVLSLFKFTQLDAVVVLQVFMQDGYLFRDGVKQSAVEIHKSCVPSYGRGNFLQLSAEI